MLRIGVIGTGVMGQNHARVIASLGSDVQLSAVCDIDENTGKQVAKRFGAEYFKDCRELRNAVDAVVIATPTKTHHEIAIAMIDAGKHVLVEKPLAIDVEKGLEIVEHAKAQGVVLAVGHIERHNPVVKFAKIALSKGQFGELNSMLSKRISPFPSRVNDVGVVKDIGVHEIDAQRYLADAEVEYVSASGGRANGGKHEDHASILLKFKNGKTGMINVNWLAPIRIREIELLCNKVFVHMDYIKQEVFISTSQIMDFNASDAYQYPTEYNVRHIYLKKDEPLRLEIQDFVDAIRERRRPLVDGNDGLENLRVCEAVLKAMEKGDVVEV